MSKKEYKSSGFTNRFMTTHKSVEESQPSPVEEVGVTPEKEEPKSVVSDPLPTEPEKAPEKEEESVVEEVVETVKPLSETKNESTEIVTETIQETPKESSKPIEEVKVEENTTETLQAPTEPSDASESHNNEISPAETEEKVAESTVAEVQQIEKSTEETTVKSDKSSKPSSGVTVTPTQTINNAPKSKTTSIRFTQSILDRLEDLAFDNGYRYKARYLNDLITAHRQLCAEGKENLPIKFKPRFIEKYTAVTTIHISMENYEWLSNEHFRATRINITDYINYILYLEMKDLGTDYIEN